MLSFEDLSSGARGRLERIKFLRNCSELEAIEFALVAGWAAAEKGNYQRMKRLEKKRGTGS